MKENVTELLEISWMTLKCVYRSPTNVTHEGKCDTHVCKEYGALLGCGPGLVNIYGQVRAAVLAQMVQRISPSMEIGPLDAPSCLVPVLAMAQACVICTCM